MTGALPNKTTAGSLYSHLQAKRSSYISDAARCAGVTIPSLFPQHPTKVDDFVTPYQSVGSRGVNNIAAKMMLALFPPKTPFFRLKVEDEVLASMSATPDIRSKVETGLSTLESRVTSELTSRGLHETSFELFKHLIVAGNVLLYLPDDGPLELHWLHAYVCRRDRAGNVLDIVLQEKIARVALDPDFRALLKASKNRDDNKDEVTIYTHVTRESTQWVAYQEVGGLEVPGTRGEYPLDKCPWIPLRLIKQAGRDYGRSYVHEYLGDLLSLEGLSQALLEGAVGAAKLLFLVNPNGVTEKDDLAKARNGDFVDGTVNDVNALQLGKYSDFRVALEQANSTTERLSFAFLLNSAVQRRGERVTAEEIRYVAQELEDSLGGLYSLLAKELQLPLATRTMYVLQQAGKLPALPEKDVKPVVVTGLEALGRSSDLSKLEQALSKAVAAVGPEQVAKRLRVADILTLVFTACGVRADGLLLSEAEVQQNDQQAMAMQMMQQGLNPAIQAGGNLIKEGMKE
ncbi:MAG: head-tail connector protein [Proteobacteria bacterium]|nr:head-tail connector protein [Pseudomonadota bacterium]